MLCEIEFLFAIKTNDTRKLEENLHKKFDNKREKGEWFNLTEQDISNVKDILTKKGYNIDCLARVGDWMIIKSITKERLDRLFNNGYGIIRFNKFALVKKYSYKYMIKELLWALIGIPLNLILNIGETALYLLNFIPSIYIQKDN